MMMLLLMVLILREIRVPKSHTHTHTHTRTHRPHSHSRPHVEEGDVFAWGNGECGQCGQGTTDDAFVPALVAALLGTRIVSVAAGRGHSACVAGACTGRTVCAWCVRAHVTTSFVVCCSDGGGDVDVGGDGGR